MSVTYSFNQLQNFTSILNDEKVTISVIIDIVPFWKKNKDMWFSHEEIVSFPTINCVYENCKELNMALILQYDQIFRHPCKSIKDEDKPKAFDFATKLAYKMIENGQYLEMDDCEKVFTLLAIRHNNTLEHKYDALHLAFDELNNEEDNNKNLWIRFINASILDIDKLKCKIGFESQLQPSKCSIYSQSYFERMRETFNHILEKRKYIDDSFDLIKTKTILKKVVEDTFKKLDTYNTFAVSISGGVDSMVLSYICNNICLKHNKKLILLHVMYNNRECCIDEVEMLKQWATYLNVELYVRNINEIQRNRNSRFRTMYEDVTRRIRFSFYKWANCPILLGHNRDDTFENMFSNLAKGIHFDNLAGMSEIGIEDGVHIVRPFLSINKCDLVSFADKLNIPHLYDSTPPWSRRGKTRDSLIPCINSFDSNILPGLEQFSKYTTFLHSQWEEQFEQWNKSNVHNDDDILTIKRDKYFDTNYKNLSFWIRMWFDNEMPTRPSNKSLKNLITNISNSRAENCDMNKHYKCVISPEKIIFKKR